MANHCTIVFFICQLWFISLFSRFYVQTIFEKHQSQPLDWLDINKNVCLNFSTKIWFILFDFFFGFSTEKKRGTNTWWEIYYCHTHIISVPLRSAILFTSDASSIFSRCFSSVSSFGCNVVTCVHKLRSVTR